MRNGIPHCTVLLSPLYCIQAGKEEDLLEKEVKKLMSMSDSDPDFQMVARYCTVLYCTVLYCTVLYCTVLYCTVLYCTLQTSQEPGLQFPALSARQKQFAISPGHPEFYK